MITFSWILAIILSFFLWASLWMFPKFYKKTANHWYLRVVMAIWILIVEGQRFYAMLNNGGWQHFPNYFSLYSCSIVAWVSVIILFFPHKIFLECFFPLAIFGPILTLFFPTYLVPLTDFYYYIFFFGHTFSLFAFLYVYLYGLSDFKVKKDTVKNVIVKSILTGLIMLLAVELFNQYFDTNYIIGDIAGALGLGDWARPWQFVITFVLGLLMIIIGDVILYFSKPIYAYKSQVKLHDTYWEIWMHKIKTKLKKPKKQKAKDKE
ncbi:TMEM164 family acyltransferase [Spiroplasma chrysopicola]|uniref:Uncharacterized protein n=1 Tax=Spiroplasma chrysopicola DF-1 TaxID=1276227 RepID=R4U3W8_9MOLU|nr:YwaF family protein [Spiroplasma chrysopicola]AGM25208.1 hypothetical protein SCHRY_v1c06320 [Spiroplasma chrysopicola DF-1]